MLILPDVNEKSYHVVIRMVGFLAAFYAEFLSVQFSSFAVKCPSSALAAEALTEIIQRLGNFKVGDIVDADGVAHLHIEKRCGNLHGRDLILKNTLVKQLHDSLEALSFTVNDFHSFIKDLLTLDLGYIAKRRYRLRDDLCLAVALDFPHLVDFAADDK